jgi:hypothetical protein
MLSDQWPIACQESLDGFRFWHWCPHRDQWEPFLSRPLVSKELAARAPATGAAPRLLLAVAGSLALILTPSAAPPRAGGIAERGIHISREAKQASATLSITSVCSLEAFCRASRTAVKSKK